MTQEQEEAARAALLKKSVDDLWKAIAYKNHCTAAEWVTLYNLPYRVALDYLKNPDKSKVQINTCYPLPGYPVGKLMKISPADIDFERYSYEKADGTKVVSSEAFEHPRPEVMEQIQVYNRQFAPVWNTDTAAGLQEWEKVFACYLIPYDFDTFTAFDMFGRTDGNEEDLNERKAYYKGVQERYKAGTDYLTEPPPYKPEYKEKYTTHAFIIQWDNNTREDI